jgi:hypothetical protein
MKNFQSFLLEGSPRVIGVDQTNDATPDEKALASKDVSKKKAVERIAKERGYKGNFRQKVSAIVGDREPENAPDDPTLQQAKEFDYARDKGGRAISPELKTAKMAAAKEKGLKPSQIDPDTEQQLIKKGVEDKPELPLRQRMARAADVIGPQGKLTGDAQVNRDINTAVRKGFSSTARKSFQIGGIDVQDIPGFRHLMQPFIQGDVKPDDFPDPEKLGPDGMWEDPESGLNYHHDGNTWKQEMSSDDALTLLGNTRDETVPGTLSKDDEGRVRTKVTPAFRGWGENPQTQKPSGEEMKTWSKQSLENAFETGEISKAQYEKSKRLIKAFAEENPEAVQNDSFSRYVGERGQKHEAVDDFLASASGIDNLMNSGLGGERFKKAYGGDLGKLGERFRVEGAPPGVYDLAAMKKKDKNLYKLAMQNRLYELTRTYLQQDGKNAYTWYEGVRSINDMNLEHIMSLANGGYDHPSNWVWSGEELNKLKNEFDLSDRAATIEKPERTSPVSGKGFTTIVKSMAKEQGKKAPDLKKELTTAVPELTMKKDEYSKLTNDEIQDARKRAADAGYPEDSIEKDLPEIKTVRPGFEGGKNEEEYEEWRLNQERNRQVKDRAMNQLRMKYGLSSFDEAGQTVEGQQILRILQTNRWETEVDKVDDVDFDIDDFDL